ncbi:gluconokinase [Heterostelium album PN500]|uniref:Gluconokinase n=1 Tax=Heterostelium pallidum (strain ATCC 26659 / Pp 5 / PN500) TaxID=670386 RepID=D3B0P0_HETP5|nr:gluconokinase [Heterostelium album PN500]EFA84864.1 gluconokinase [Heterostelium album PN500]|eukprot:XP_020436975.1 gluconokinase [Heterostelium album PN500]
MSTEEPSIQSSVTTCHCVVVMGVSGSGKSVVGYSLSTLLRCKFIDGDDLHPRANILKMASGQPLNDDDRLPWLIRLNDVAFSLSHKNERGVLVCSALKRRYRDILRKDNPGIMFIYLKGSFEVILERLQARSGHFMPSSLLTSQFQALEEPSESEEPDVLHVNIDTGSVEEVSKLCYQMLYQRNF